MADKVRTTPDTLMRSLHEAPYRWDFFQAVRRLDCAFADRPATGTGTRPGQEPVRFAQEPTLAFAPATIASFTPPHDGRPGRMAIYAVGLLGPHGPMPLVFTDYVRDRKRNYADGALSAFLDIFHHRMIALLYRAWASGQKAVQYERGDRDEFVPFVASLIGFGGGWSAPSRRGGDLPFHALLHYSGAMSNQSRHAAGLEAMLADFLGIPVKIETFIGRWLPIPVEDRCVLGGAVGSRGCAILGQTATIGSCVWECQQSFRLRIGPMSLVDYDRLLPGGGGLTQVTTLVAAYIGEELAWSLRLVLRGAEVPGTRLGQAGRLGWTTWLGKGGADGDVDDLDLTPPRSARVPMPVGLGSMVA